MKVNTLLPRYVFLGPPGSGKGTQAIFLASKIGIPHISTGALFREAVSTKTALGEKIAIKMSKGEYVSDEETNAIIDEAFKVKNLFAGYILDGYPRTMDQVLHLEKMAPPSSIILLDIPDDEVVKRISGRLVCSSCGATYHKLGPTPKDEGVCDKCGQKLITRADDAEDAVRQRLAVYHKSTEPLINFYLAKGSLIKIDGRLSVNDVRDSINNNLI